jgi:2-iminobutanoate/2-iminopropanoate deaminase
MEKEIVHPKDVYDPQASKRLDSTGLPWSQAVKAKGLVFISGQVSLDSDLNIVGKGDIVAQTRQALNNLELVVRASGGDLSNVVHTTWFVTSIDEFYKKGASTVRREVFKKDFPTSTLVEIKRLAEPELMVEVEAIAVI